MSYEQTASVYDAIYTQMKDYPAETARVLELWGQYAASASRTSILDVACGTGLHLATLKEFGFADLVGVDLSEAQLAVARTRLDGSVQLEVADMTDFWLGRQFDLVTCLFSAIGHVSSLRKLRRAITAMAAHLNLGGVLMIEPWLFPENFTPNHVGINVVDTPGLKVLRMSTSVRRGNLIHLELQHIVGRPGESMEVFSETHRLMMFTHEEFETVFRELGLAVHYDENGLMGRGLYVAIKQSNKQIAWYPHAETTRNQGD